MLNGVVRRPERGEGAVRLFDFQMKNNWCKMEVQWTS